MSVYKRPGAETYSFDFERGGHRFSGDTGQKERRKAVAEEDRRKKLAEEELRKNVGMEAPQTWGQAASRWFHEVGSHHVNVDTTLSNLAWLTKEIGAATPLTLVNDNVVTRLVAKRRKELRKVGKATDRDKQRPVSPATVNRTVTEPLRKVWLLARDGWYVPVGRIKWKKHMLKEPQERVREARPDEEAGVMEQLGRGYDAAVEFAFLSGCRRMEIIALKKTDVDFFNRQFTVTGKGGKSRTIPMSDQIYRLLWSLKDMEGDAVFSYIAARNDARKKLVKGKRYPMTDAGLKTAMKRAVEKAGVTNLRFHDTRHTTATRVLRKSNLRVVQNLLGHQSVTTTAKYAHAQSEDIRAALNAASPTEIPTTPADGDAKVLSGNEK